MKKGKCDFHADRQGEFRAKSCMFLTLPSDVLSLWRNRLARSAVNRKVGGSSPPRDGPFAHLDRLYLDVDQNAKK